MFVIRKKDMKTAVAGACVLASGGGGSYQVACEIIEQGIPDDARVTLIGRRTVERPRWVAGRLG